MTATDGQLGRRRAKRLPALRGGGFTLVEMMVVFLIISLLLTILVPTINSILESAAKNRCRARITSLAEGATNYKLDKNFFPGQQYTHKLAGGTVDPTDSKQYTGSQVLAAALFGYTFAEIEGKPVGSNQYADFSPDLLATLKSQINTISDGYSNPMAICYYPSRLGVKGINQFKQADNNAYTVAPDIGTGTNDTFDKRITHPTLGGAVNSEGILLIAPSTDRKYFTQDDLKNW